MGLDDRKMRILQAIIDDYIMTAAPVGSRTISRHAELGLSSATIRNEMFDLKELGFLEQPHTSAGSMPSDKAYRLYVDGIMQSAELTTDEIAAIRTHFSDRITDTETVVKKTAVVLSQLTNCMSMVMTPQIDDVKLKRIQLISVSDERALLIVVTNMGLLKDTVITVPQGLSSQNLDMISAMLTERFSGCTLRDVSEDMIFDLFTELGERREFLTFVDELAATINSPTGSQEKHVELHGARNLLNLPEYSDIERARLLISTIEQNERLSKLLANAEKNGDITITIGSENDDPELRDCSVVTARYRVGNVPIGSLGVVGPTRMDYPRVVAVLQNICSALSDVLTQMLGDDKPPDKK